MIGEAFGLTFVRPGQRPSAGQQNIMVRMHQAGHRGSTIYEDGTGTYIWPLLRGTKVRWFELKDALTPGSHATAHRRKWDADAEEYETDTNSDAEFEVYDELGLWRGRAKDAYASPHDAGSIGWAEKRDARWQIIQMQPAALAILGTATTDWSTATFAIDGVSVLNPVGGLITDADPAGNITLQNLFGWTGSEDDSVVGIWNEASGHWIALTPTFVAQSTLTDFQVDTANQELEVKSRALKVMATAAESAWTVKHTGSVCP